MTNPRAHLIRRLSAYGAMAVLPLTMMGCGDDTSDEVISAQQGAASAEAIAPGPEAATEARRVEATVIDVRTPEEFEAGHVTGAELIDIQGPDFGTRIAELDPDVTYVVYCRSGNRSATAATQMRAIGLTVLDGGALDDMSGAGWPTTAP